MKVRSPLCFFVPGTQSKEWRYGLALENVQDNAKHAPVLLQNGKIRSFSRRNIESASRRMTDTSKQANKAWETPVYIKQFSPALIRSLDDKWTQFFTLTPDEQSEVLRGADEVFKSRKVVQHKVFGKPARTPAAAKQKQCKSKWKMNTQVATNKPVLPGGVASPSTTHSGTGINWVRGLITKFHGDSACPYEITWDTQPEPIMHRKNAEEVADLVANFLHCIKLRLLQGYVGLDLLWQKDASKVTSSASSPDQPIKPSLQYGMVRNFDPLMDKYKVLFRTGIWTWKTEEDVKEAQKFTDIVITGQHGSWSFEDAQVAAQQPSTIFESQQEEISTTNVGDALASSQRKTEFDALTASEVSAMLFPKKPTRVLPARVSKQANVKRAVKTWKCGKTKVATMNGNNTRFPNLPKNRTGWTVGTLRRDDGNVMQPYFIEWDVQPIVSHFVSYEEMAILVRHHKQCSARKLVNMFCVGMDLLWKTPHPANPNRVRWVTVMFWDAKHYKSGTK